MKMLEEEGFKSASENWKCWRRNNVFGQSIPDPTDPTSVANYSIATAIFRVDVYDGLSRKS